MHATVRTVPWSYTCTEVRGSDLARLVLTLASVWPSSSACSVVPVLRNMTKTPYGRI